LNIHWARLYEGQEILISFRMFNTDNRMIFREFNALFRLPVYADHLKMSKVGGNLILFG